MKDPMYDGTVADTQDLLGVIASLVEELGTELELKDNDELALLAGTPTLQALVRGADAVRDGGGTVPPVVASLLGNVERANAVREAERSSLRH